METLEFDIEFLAQKIAENPNSVLFARMADLYLEKNQVDESLKLCEEGIKRFPRYTAGYVVLGKTCLALKEFSKARSAFEKAKELSPFNKKIDSLLREIPEGPDESQRLTDADYFENKSPGPGGELSPADVQQPTEEGGADGGPVNASLFDTMTPEEMMYMQQSGEVIENPVPGSTALRGDQQGFPSFDEYAAQQQPSPDAQPTGLDDFLNSSPADTPPAQQPPGDQGDESVGVMQADQSVDQQPLEEVQPTQEQTVEMPAETNEQPLAAEPEQVFASPEQAALYADMSTETPQPAQEENFDSLTEKLQQAEKIVPTEQPLPPPEAEVGEESGGYSTDMVTPTLAEIYASQGEYRAAIQAYEILIFSQPDKGSAYQKRIQELQRLQMEKDGLV